MSRSVLIVDDEQHIRLLIEQTLEELSDEGVELYTASDGEEALAAIEAQRPDLVFLDVMMPAERARGRARRPRRAGLADIHIVLLTAKGQAYDREQGMAAGADRYLTKPFDPDELLAIAREVLGDGMSELRRLIVRHRNVAPMVSALLAGTDAARDDPRRRGAVVLERDGVGARDGTHPVIVDGETAGHGRGRPGRPRVAAVLAYAAARERDKRSLANEALERYRELSLIYDLAAAIGGTPISRRSWGRRPPSSPGCRTTRMGSSSCSRRTARSPAPGGADDEGGSAPRRPASARASPGASPGRDRRARRGRGLGRPGDGRRTRSREHRRGAAARG